MGKDSANNIKTLYGSFSGDFYIIGSGATMNHFSKQFFVGRNVICLNNMYKFFPCTFMVTHHHEIVQEAINSGARVVTSKHEIAVLSNTLHNFDGDYYYYEHNNQGFENVDMNGWGNLIVAGGTPVVSSMQIAWKLGASNIILCGVDGGKLDGQMNYSEYPVATRNGHPGRVQDIIEKVAGAIRAEGVGVYGLLPFVNMTLEGHTFKTN